MTSNIRIFFALAIFAVSTKTGISVPAEASIGEPLWLTNGLKSNEKGVEVGTINQEGLCLSQHNNARSQNGKGALTYDSRLETAARNHNQVMTSQNCFSHQCPGEQGLGDRVTSTGYKWWGVAENIAAGQSDCNSAVTSWMNSDGHRANILGDYKNIGCAMAQCSSCTYNPYWTCVFGNPQ